MARERGDTGQDLLRTMVNAAIDTDIVQAHEIGRDMTEPTAIDTVRGAVSTEDLTTVQTDHGNEDLIGSARHRLQESSAVDETHGAGRLMRTTGDGIEGLLGCSVHTLQSQWWT